MTSSVPTGGVAKQQLSVSELVNTFMNYYGVAAPWKQRQQETSRTSRFRPPSRRGRRPGKPTEHQAATSSDEQPTREAVSQKSTQFPYITIINDVDTTNDDVKRFRRLRHNNHQRTMCCEETCQNDVRRQLRIVGKNTAMDIDTTSTSSNDCFPVRIRRHRRSSPPANDVTATTSLAYDAHLPVVDVIARSMNCVSRDVTRPAHHRFRGQQTAAGRGYYSDSGVIYDNNRILPDVVDRESASPVQGGVFLSSYKQMTIGNKKPMLCRNLLPVSTDCQSVSSTSFQSMQTETGLAEKLYTDPMSHASPSFNQRIGEIIALELKTIRWEKTRRLKKKRSRDSL